MRSSIYDMHSCLGVESGTGTGSAHNGHAVHFENYDRCVVLANFEVGGATNDVQLSIQQGKWDGSSFSATGVFKALGPLRFYLKQDTTAHQVENFTLVEGNHVTVQGNNENIVMVEVNASELDLKNGFNAIRVRTDGGGAAGKLYGAIMLMTGARYRVAPDGAPPAQV